MVERKKPEFKRQDSHKKKRLHGKWRTARGLQSKIRLALKGYRKKPKNGYGSQKITKGLVKNQKFIEVSSLKDLENIPKDYSILIKNIGMKNKIEIVKKAVSLKIKILNIKNADLFLKEKEEILKKKKEEKKVKDNLKENKKVESEKKAKIKEAEKKKEIEKTEEDLEKEKKEGDELKKKVLTHKEK